LRNGDLLRAAELDGFDVLITSGKNIRHQNRLGGLRIAILELGTNHRPTLQLHAETVSVAQAHLIRLAVGTRRTLFMASQPKSPRSFRSHER
jgi:hypothetical protein